MKEGEGMKKKELDPFQPHHDLDEQIRKEKEELKNIEKDYEARHADQRKKIRQLEVQRPSAQPVKFGQSINTSLPLDYVPKLLPAWKNRLNSSSPTHPDVVRDSDSDMQIARQALIDLIHQNYPDPSFSPEPPRCPTCNEKMVDFEGYHYCFNCMYCSDQKRNKKNIEAAKKKWLKAKREEEKSKEVRYHGKGRSQ